MPGGLSRRCFLGTVATAAMAPTAFPQSSSIRLRKLHCSEIRVSDVRRSKEFYQGLFGMPESGGGGGYLGNECLTTNAG